MAKNPLNTLGASNLSNAERSKLDYYGTDPRSTEAMLEKETFNSDIWEPCAGHHLMVDVLKQHGYSVRASDIAEYEGYEHEIVDFLNLPENVDWDGDIVTNPPYNLATEFAVKALSILKPGKKLALFLRLQFLEGQKRDELIFTENPAKVIYYFVNRQVCSKVDDFTEGSAVAYAWFIWEKGYTGETVVRKLNTNK